MDELKKIINRIITERKLDSNTTVYKKNYNGKNFYSIEGINIQSGDEEKYLIYDCSRNDISFNYNEYASIISKDDANAIPILVFKNWDDEMQQYFTCRENLNGLDKKQLTDFFRYKSTIYTDMEDKIMLSIKNPENFNEHIVHTDGKTETLEGYIYNLSLYELKRLYNITGDELFKKNVRKGLRKSITIDNIIKSFNDYIKAFIKMQLDNSKDTLNSCDIDTIKQNLEITDIEKYSDPKYFWFCHNGITIYSFNDEKLDRSGASIVLNPSKVSVINGAQTLTNFFRELENTKHKLSDSSSNLSENLKEFVNSINLDDILKDIFVKTIFISGSEDFVKPITYGLNKQVPVLNEHILADSETVYDINLILKKKHIEILREGDGKTNVDGLNVIDFAKKHLIIVDHPGTSKNLRKSELEDILTKALKIIQKDENHYLNSLKLLIDLDDLWKESKKKRDLLNSDNDNYSILNSFGKNYFGSYLVRKANKYPQIYDIDEAIFDIQYSEFLKIFMQIKQPLSLTDFKSDNLYSKFLEIYNTNISESKEKINCEDLKEYLTTHIKSQYSVNKTIVDYLTNVNINLQYFRVITRVKNKCKEAFPFPNSTFTELYSYEESNSQKLNFDNSKFKSEIEKVYPIFIIERDAIKTEIVSVSFMSDFSFKDYINEAREVFNITLKAFESGNTSDFPKASLNKKFHIRPKAINSNDTFEFTNGELITKRTFWANKDTVDEIINKNKN